MNAVTPIRLSRPRTCLAALERGCMMTFVTFAGTVTARVLDSCDWASVTFVGQRHRVRIELEGPGAVGAAADFLGRMGDLEFDLPGTLVADVALLAEERHDDGTRAALDLEILTIAEG